LAPDTVRYAYVYAIALNGTGAPAQSLALLERVHQRHPADRDVLVALIAGARTAGDLASAISHARELTQLDPGNQQASLLLRDLENRQKQ
jgi:Flp pilus assembly protein TadD